jgi:hypothetical protein
MLEADPSKPSHESGKWALVVGIDQYAHLDDRYQLEGCVNDARAMAQVLIDRFGFPTGQVNLLTDEQATKAALLKALYDLAGRVGENDIVVFHYSGHGSQRTDGPEKDEDDGKDETLLACDSGRGGPEPNQDLSDDDIHAWLVDIGRKTPYVTLIFDCCHSGTAVREGPDAIASYVRAREVPPDLRPYERLRPTLYVSPFTGAPRGVPEGIRPHGESGWLPDDAKYTLIAGCKSRERSYEVRLFEGGGPSQAHGALTYHLIQALRRAEPDDTYRDVFEQAAAAVSTVNPMQHPQLEGARDRQLFGPLYLEPMRFVAVQSCAGETVTLAAGACGGLTAGSIWEIHPPGTRKAEGRQPLARVEVQIARVVDSEAVILPGTQTGEIGPGCRAVEVLHDFNPRLTVTLDDLGPAGPAAEWLRQRLADSLLLSEVPAGGEVRVRVACGQWEVVSGDTDTQILPPVPLNEPGGLRRLVDNLEREARYLNVLALENPNSAFHDKIDLEILRQNGGGWLPIEPDAAGEVVVREGERIAVHVRNRHERALCIQILDLGLTKSISMLHPVPGGLDMTPRDGAFEIGVRTGDEIHVRIPDEFPFNQNGAAPRRGREILKLFATTDEVDLSPLLQRSPRFGQSGPLEALFGAATGAFKVPREFVRNAPRQDWTVITRTVVVERA